jgi:uncharacterized protein YbaP (TraB family)
MQMKTAALKGWHFFAAVALTLAAAVPARAQAGTGGCPPEVPAMTQAFLQRAAAQAADRGLLWRIELGGRTSWLYGSMHVGRGEWMVPGPLTARALRESDAVALELDLLDPAVLAAMTAPADPAIARRVLQGPRLARMQAAMAKGCAPAALLQTQRPFMQAVTLTMLEARREGLYAEMAVEAVLAAAARQMGKPLIGLETAQVQLDALMPRNDAEESEMVDSILDELASGGARNQVSKLADVWARGDEAALANYEQWCGCVNTATDRELLKRLLQDRNPGLAGRIAQLHKGGQRLFAAVGALHTVGDGSVVQLLKAQGFTVTRVEPARP